ncbi:hypothetical protein [Fibrobacter sp. UWB12]|uniref:hypothetical protein n=1 Tax=Fibrobacter sp. UWB12 TaxID=1896203 RepID=UPI000923247F|nr:hypothetical protein [Fibrobacter sp. UWB12]SHK21630.1 hypothetical protein SAMN05720759_101153 [Fibrobacter sp. UWB12]
MAKNFSKFLGKVALMTAAALWAGCNDSDKKSDVSQSQILGNAAQSANSSLSADTLVSENEFAESSASDSVAVIEPAKDSLLKKVARVAKMKPEIGMIRALYGVIEENMGRAVALYGVRPPREIVSPDDPREISRPPRSVPRCLVKELTEDDVVVGKDNDIDVKYFLKAFRQRSPAIRHICNKNLYKNVKYSAKRAKEFEGETVFELKISPSGNVENVEIKSTNDQFSEEIRKSIARWAFPKTQRGGTFTFPVNLYEVIPSAASSASEQPLSLTE